MEATPLRQKLADALYVCSLYVIALFSSSGFVALEMHRVKKRQRLLTTAEHHHPPRLPPPTVSILVIENGDGEIFVRISDETMTLSKLEVEIIRATLQEPQTITTILRGLGRTDAYNIQKAFDRLEGMGVLEYSEKGEYYICRDCHVKPTQLIF